MDRRLSLSTGYSERQKPSDVYGNVSSLARTREHDGNPDAVSELCSLSFIKGGVSFPFFVPIYHRTFYVLYIVNGGGKCHICIAKCRLFSLFLLFSCIYKKKVVTLRRFLSAHMYIRARKRKDSIGNLGLTRNIEQ